MKALLVLGEHEVPKTHNLVELNALLPDAWRPDVPPRMLDRLYDYATVTRYPGDYDEITSDEARRAIAVARTVRKGGRAILPKEALRRRRKR
jgi:HEPN domain-containing protein